MAWLKLFLLVCHLLIKVLFFHNQRIREDKSKRKLKEVLGINASELQE